MDVEVRKSKLPDQLELTTKELKQEITRVLTANNPNAPQNLVRFDFKERQYKLVPRLDQTAIHFVLEGNFVNRNSITRRPLTPKNQTSSVRLSSVDKTALAVLKSTQSRSSQSVSSRISERYIDKEANEQIKNQFTVTSRGTQTPVCHVREQFTSTEPPPRIVFSANATQWAIYDAYEEDYKKLNQRKKTSITENVKVPFEKTPNKFAKISNAVTILERMVNQNSFDEIAQDYKYYDDPSDEYRGEEGTLLPLWRFHFESDRKLAVTALCWSTKYTDLFAVGHGSFEFVKNVTGLICYYSLKNPCYPEYIFETESGVMCLDIHPQMAQLLCVGFYNGSVAVYNVSRNKSSPVFISNTKNGKHNEPVWGVKWQSCEKEAILAFNSVSSDGRVSIWRMIKEGLGACHDSSINLECMDIINLQTINDVGEEEPTGRNEKQGSGTCFDFHKKMNHIFIVGTEEGYVHEFSKTINSQCLEKFFVHSMAVYNVVWNNFHPHIFMTCSADWTVKIWDHRVKTPVFVFDLNSSVEDVAWAPFSSTVFAAVTVDGKVHVFDLSVNKIEAICVQTVVRKRKTKLTKVSFNWRFPIIIVGDDKNHVTSFKLSPNLRRPPKEKKDSTGKRYFENQADKLDEILKMVG